MSTAPALPQPARFLRLGWRAARRAPAAFFLRVAVDVVAYAARATIVFGLGLLVVLHLATHIEGGRALEAWPAALGSVVARPGVLLGGLGALFTAWLAMLAAESLAFAGVWSALRRGVDAPQPVPFGAVFAGALASFPDALKVRVLVRAAEAALVALGLGTVAILVSLGDAAAATSGSPVVVPALMWALALTVLTSSIAAIRLTAEFVAAALFIDGVPLGEAILRAAQRVISHPIYVYRLFVVSAAVLIPPLLLAWAAALSQNLLLGNPAGELLALVMRTGAELTILLGLALFSVVLHGTFFMYYAWESGRAVELDAPPRRPLRRMISLKNLVPHEYPHVVDVDDLLGPWADEDVLPVVESTTAPPTGPYDLDAILRPDDDPQRARRDEDD